MLKSCGLITGPMRYLSHRNLPFSSCFSVKSRISWFVPLRVSCFLTPSLSVVNFQIIILLVVAIVEAGLQEFKEAVILFSVVIVNIIIGFSQEYKAKQALEALMSLSVPGVSHDETMLAEEED